MEKNVIGTTKVVIRAGTNVFEGLVVLSVAKNSDVMNVILSPSEARDIAAKLVEAANKAEDDERISYGMGTWED